MSNERRARLLGGAASVSDFLWLALVISIPVQWASAIWLDGRWFWMSLLTIVVLFFLDAFGKEARKKIASLARASE